MPDVYTTQSSSAISKALWSKAIQFPYRDELHFDQIANAKSITEGGFRGKSVTWTYVNDLALATTPIDEIVGPDAVTYTTSTKTVELAEYANTTKSTALARTTGFVDVDQILVNIVGFNAGASIDSIVATELMTSANIQRANNRANNGAITATDVLTTKELEIAHTEMTAANVPKINGYYNLYVHPYQLFDLRTETGAMGWRQLPEQSGVGSDQLINGTVGEWAGFRVIVANRAPMVANTGSGGTVDIYNAIATGADCLVKGYSDHPEAPGSTPEVRFGLAVDALGRNKPVSWYHLVGYEILREQGVRLIKTASSRGANS